MTKLTDIAIKKSTVESSLANHPLVDAINTKNESHYVVNVVDEKEGQTALLNIYFKKSGKVSFLAQGQHPDIAVALAMQIVESVK
ncbi:hypothetical protein [Paraburkholderia aromaticivorans]|uniref:hypothetical protein n=1 Tax=Paraburkholderia aromaticivorans TaxID=2026199 RepID=UPI0038B76116